MKKRFKKITVIAAAAAMILSLSGCNSQNVSENENNTKENADERVEISIATWNADEGFVGDDVLKELEDKLNIKINPVNITWDDFGQKIQLWASSSSLPDLFVGDFRNTSTYAQWAEQGVVKEIPEDLSAYPVLEEYLSGQSAKEAKINDSLYCIPRQSYPSQEWTSIDRFISYRWDLAQEAGITKEPETWEEFQEMIKAIVAADPDGTGVGGTTAADKTLLGGLIMPYASSIAADNGSAFKWVLADDGTYQPVYFHEDLVPAFQLARDMYESGVIEKDIALTTNQSAEEKFLQGKSAAIVMSGGFGNKYSTISRYWKEVHGTEYTDDVKAFCLAPDYNGNKAYPVWNYAWSESYINANVSDEKLDKILQLYDYLLTDEGAFLTTYGPEGMLYDMVDGKVQMKNQGTLVKDTYPCADVFQNLVRWVPNVYDDRFPTDYPDAYNQVNLKIAEEAKDITIPEYFPECTQIVMELGLEFTVNFDDDFLNIMTGSKPVEKMWEDTVKQYESKGLEDVINQVNSAMKK